MFNGFWTIDIAVVCTYLLILQCEIQRQGDISMINYLGYAEFIYYLFLKTIYYAKMKLESERYLFRENNHFSWCTRSTSPLIMLLVFFS
jgi:hypothetical protein